MDTTLVAEPSFTWRARAVRPPVPPPQADPAEESERFIRRLKPEQIGLRLFQYLPDVFLFVKNRWGQFMRVNRSEVEFLGARSEDGVVGKTDFDFFTADLAGHYVGNDQDIMRTGRADENSIGMVPNRECELEWHVGTKVPLYDRGGRIVGIAGFTRKLAACERPAVGDERLWKAADFVRANYPRKLTVPDLADAAELPERTLARRFILQFRMTPLRYIRTVRLNAACRALRGTAKPLVEVALECGYSDQSHMTGEFRTWLGITPGQYRRERP
jgi:AraC-like DNA-binding protein